MKKLSIAAFIFILILVLPFNLAAQHVGAHIGTSIFTLKNTIQQDGLSFSLNNKSRVGIAIGAFAEFPLRSKFLFRPELNFIQKGGELNFTDGTDKVETKHTLNYLEVPLNFYYTTDAGKGKLLLGVGPYFGIGISGKAASVITLSGQTTSASSPIKFDGKNEDQVTDDNVHYKALDYGLTCSGGYRLPGGLSFIAGYQFGFSNNSPNSSLKLNNRGFNFKIGYLLSQKK
ncbi:MAG: porin family protein [Ferruginibacter sp.]